MVSNSSKLPRLVLISQGSALDDAGVILGADIDAESHRLDAAARQALGGLLGGGNAVVGVFGEDANLLDVGNQERGLPQGGRSPGAQRRDAEDELLLVAGDGVVPGLGEDHGDLAIVGDILRGDADRAMIAAADRDHAVLGDQLLHDGRCLFRQAFGIGDDHFDVAAKDTTGSVDVGLGNQHRRAHPLAPADRAGCRQRRQAADLDRATRGFGPGAIRRQGHDGGGDEQAKFLHWTLPVICPFGTDSWVRVEITGCHGARTGDCLQGL